MGTLLTRALLVAVVAAALARAAVGTEAGDRNQWQVEIDAGYVGGSSPLGSWTDHGLGKLRYSEADDGLGAARIFAQYHGRLRPTLSATDVLDNVDDASSGLDVTEAFLDWRPVPTSGLQQQLRVGAFYPPLSLENGAAGWQSPYSYSYSAIDTWLGEEIRPLGVEWSMRRRLGFAGSPHELRAFASGFYANDPAGTLLFWRGWALHDRQSRWNDDLPMPPAPIWNGTGTIVGLRQQSVRPFEEIDHDPGFYAGAEWRYARRVLVQLARYDNRADPYAFAGGQWAWHTRFTSAGIQASLAGNVGLIAQWLDGSTYWIQGATRSGTLTPAAALVDDRFGARFVMLSGLIRGKHRLSLRRDAFDVRRHDPAPLFDSDDGDAWTLAYRYERSARWNAGLEWLTIESRRDLWPNFYGAPPRATERALRFEVDYRLGSRGTRGS
jgi:hypothetical protein